MSTTVWKYPVPEPGRSSSEPVPMNAEFVSLHNRHVYLAVDTKYAGDKCDRLEMFTTGTGHVVGEIDNNMRPAGTWSEDSPLGPLVWHTFFKITHGTPKNCLARPRDDARPGYPVSKR